MRVYAGGLSDQEAQFINHYLVLGSAKEAARRAGYSESFAAKKSYQLLKREAVKAAIEAGELIENQEELGVTRAQAVSVLSGMVLATPDMLLDDQDGLAILSTSGVYKHAIREFTTSVDQRRQVRKTTLKFCNKVSAVRELRMLGVLKEEAGGQGETVGNARERERTQEVGECGGLETGNWKLGSRVLTGARVMVRRGAKRVAPEGWKLETGNWKLGRIVLRGTWLMVGRGAKRV